MLLKDPAPQTDRILALKGPTDIGADTEHRSRVQGGVVCHAGEGDAQ